MTTIRILQPNREPAPSLHAVNAALHAELEGRGINEGWNHCALFKGERGDIMPGADSLDDDSLEHLRATAQDMLSRNFGAVVAYGVTFAGKFKVYVLAHSGRPPANTVTPLDWLAELVAVSQTAPAEMVHNIQMMKLEASSAPTNAPHSQP